jgi:hypothetical protein
LPVTVCLGGNLRDRRIDQCVEALLIYTPRLTAADDVGTQHLEVIDVVKVILSLVVMSVSPVWWGCAPLRSYI